MTDDPGMMSFNDLPGDPYLLGPARKKGQCKCGRFALCFDGNGDPSCFSCAEKNGGAFIKAKEESLW